jgi:hypothetical protein
MKTALIVCALVLCAGCKPREDLAITQDDKVDMVRDDEKFCAFVDPGIGYCEFTLEDETRCVTTYKGGVTCNWNYR